MSQITITPEHLATSAHKYRRELLMMAIIGLSNSLQHMRIRTGVRYKETVGQMNGDSQLGPYDPSRKDKAPTIDGRTLETFLGSVITEFDPNDVHKSLYGSSIVSGVQLKDTDIVKNIIAFKLKQLSKNLNRSLFRAVRKDAGTKTDDLFNGFDTIAKNEITAGKIAVANKNLFVFTEQINNTNAVDILKEYYRASSYELQEENVKMFIPIEVMNAYNDDYQMTVGSVPYNREFKKTFLEGSNNRCEFVPLANKTDSSFLQLTTQSNMLVGVDQESELEKLSVDRFSAFMVTLSAAMFMGTQYETISPEKLLIGQLKTE